MRLTYPPIYKGGKAMKTRKFTALLLVLCLLLTATPYSAPVRAVEEEHLAQEQTQEQTQVEAQEQVETQRSSYKLKRSW